MSEETTATRSAILTRLIRTIVCFIAFEIVKISVVLLVLFQYGQLLVLKKRNDHVRKLSNRLAWYAYRALRYGTLNENTRPFPFNAPPKAKDIEPPSRTVRYD